jgi:hypothetical protein
MAVPASAEPFTQTMDPHEILDWEETFSRGDGEDDLLQVGESFVTYTLERYLEAVTMGLVIKTDPGYVTTLTGGNVLRFWSEIDETKRDDSMFDTEKKLPLLFTGWTDNNPPRKRQRTLIIKAENQ